MRSPATNMEAMWGLGHIAGPAFAQYSCNIHQPVMFITGGLGSPCQDGFVERLSAFPFPQEHKLYRLSLRQPVFLPFGADEKKISWGVTTVTARDEAMWDDESCGEAFGLSLPSRAQTSPAVFATVGFFLAETSLNAAFEYC